MKNEKKQEQLQDALGMIDQKLIARAAKQPMKYSTRIKWISAVAAVLVVCIVFGALMGSGVLSAPQNNGGAHPLFPSAQLAVAKYPQMTQYPGDENYNSDEYRQWSEECRERRSYFAAGEDLHTFFERTVAEFLGGESTENLVYSPLSTYMALAMVAETAGGNSRAQILDLLGVESIEALRTQANAVWKANYYDDGLVTSLLGSSVWMNDFYSFREETLQVLAENYYASSFSGEMGSEDYNQMLRDWLNEQTRGALKEQIDALELSADTVMALVSTVYFCAKWESGFLKSAHTQEVFHSTVGDVTVEFMHGCASGEYYWGEHFSAVGKPLMQGARMYFILPEEGMTLDELARDGEMLSFMSTSPKFKWEKHKSAMIDFSVPKFDASSEIDLIEGLKNLGVTDCFDAVTADFSPLIEGDEDLFIGEIKHSAGVAIDEEGVVGAAMTMVQYFEESAPIEFVTFTLDRPFLFVVESEGGMPLFVGTVNQI